MGYLRARRSIKLGGGVRLNVSKRSVGVSVGTRGARYSVNSRGRRQTTVGIPGTGLSYVNVRGGGQRREASTARQPVLPAAGRVGPPKPGLFAPHYEKAFAKGVQAYASGDHAAALERFKEAAATDTKARSIADDFFAGLVSVELGKLEDAVTYLEKVVRSDQPLPDALTLKYAPHFSLTMLVNERIPVSIELGSVTAVLVLADCYGQLERIEEAIGLLQQLVDHDNRPFLILQLCLLYQRVEDWDELIHASRGISNVDDLTLVIRLLAATAMEHKDLDEAALEVYKDTLRSKKRDQELLKEARYQRALLYRKLGKNGMAKRDFSRIYAEDPEFKDVAELIA